MPRLCAFLFLLAAPTDYTIRQTVLGSPMVLRGSQRTAGAIDSLKFRGKEYVNAFYRGREWQSAVSYDGFGECLNPTEAGSSKDGTGTETSSQLLDARVKDFTLTSTVRMAYWLAPEEPYKAACGQHKDVHVAQNEVVLSGRYAAQARHGGLSRHSEHYRLHGHLEIVAEPHQSMTLEAVTGYMPPEFSLFLTFDPATSQVAPLSDGPGEQPLPIIVSTKDRQSAVGVYSPNPTPSYGRFLFTQNPGVKGLEHYQMELRVPRGNHTYRDRLATTALLRSARWKRSSRRYGS